MKEEYAKKSKELIESKGTARGLAAFKETQKWEGKIVAISEKLNESRAKVPGLIKKISSSEQKYRVAQGNLYKAKKTYRKAQRERAEEKLVPEIRQTTKLPFTNIHSASNDTQK